MSKFIGRRVNLGLGKETSRGTAVAAGFWIPNVDAVVDDVIEQIVNVQSYGRIEGSEGADTTEVKSAATVSGRIQDTSFGLLLLALLGTEAAPALIETGVYDHVFSVLNTAQHPSLTLALEDPNTTTSSALRYALGMLDSLDIKMALRAYAMFTAQFKANKSATATNTPTYSAENYFRPQDATFKLATTQAGLTAASATAIKSFSLSIKKNVDEDYVLGTTAPADRLNKNIEIEGSVELMYDDRTQIDTILLGDVYRAMRFAFVNNDITLGATSHPSLTIDLNRVKYKTVARKMSDNDFVLQTIAFKAHYSLTDAAMLTATLRNTRSTAY